ncbi:GGDEF domain-containing protein [Motilimonas pumila]|uniref:diguanylate cyclase n=1 Tax=Motilimonas pumila TaxID=2303987 RepID=A0A418YC16_9GAMM|nr:GGDEF domain-containing protein [Motilimonas pumila]RJG42020.1 GGDEF domain-containing protein [Motilimonas pumila]
MKVCNNPISFTGSARRDLTLVLCIIAVISFISIRYDMAEFLIEFSSRYETFELDELMPVGMVMGLCFGWFSWRRWKEITQLYHAVEKLSLQDPITHINNRRAANIELGRLQKRAEPYGVLLLDIDNYKQINETLGYDVGDEILVKKATLLEQAIGDKAFIARWAGPQFIVFCPRFDVHQTQALASKLHKALSDDLFQSMKINLFIGITQSYGKESAKQMLEQAQDALFEAKAQGNGVHQQWA